MTGRSVAFANGVVYELREDRGVGDCSWLNINRWPAEGNEKSERAKAAVCDAESGDNAFWLAVGSAPIHLLLTEFPSLGADFPELTKQFRTIHPAAPVLLVLGAFETFDVGVHNLGCFGVMAKPFTVDELSTKVHQSMTRTAIPRCQRPEAARALFDWQYCQLETR